jgi:hypothetical protein
VGEKRRRGEGKRLEGYIRKSYLQAFSPVPHDAQKVFARHATHRMRRSRHQGQLLRPYDRYGVTSKGYGVTCSGYGVTSNGYGVTSAICDIRSSVGTRAMICVRRRPYHFGIVSKRTKNIEQRGREAERIRGKSLTVAAEQGQNEALVVHSFRGQEPECAL